MKHDHWVWLIAEPNKLNAVAAGHLFRFDGVVGDARKHLEQPRPQPIYRPK